MSGDGIGIGVLVLRRDGATWGVAHGDVRGLGRGAGGGFEVTVAAGALAADEILGVAALASPPLPAGPVLRRFWPEAARGLAVHGTLPLVLIDPAAPPAALRAGAGPGDATRREGDRRDGD